MKYDNIYIWGDSHGDYFKLVSFVKHDMKPHSLICHVGDWGKGFNIRYFQQQILEECQELLLEKHSQIFVIRGNHDDPSYFDGRNEGRITFLKDYTFMDINDERFGFIGGATSIDRCARREGVSWWRDETFVADLDKCEKCDVLILHSAPHGCAPVDDASKLERVIQMFTLFKPGTYDYNTMFNDLWNERCDIKRVVEACEAKFIYYGHFHFSGETQTDKYHATLLNIDECKKHY